MTAPTGRRARQHRTLLEQSATAPLTIPGTRTGTGAGTASRPLPPGPHRGGLELNRRQADVLELLKVGKPRDLFEVANALSILTSEAWRTLQQLIRRDLVEEIHGYPTTWRAL